MRRFGLIILILALTQAASAAWKRQTLPTFSWLNDIVFVDGSKGFIIGSSGTFLESADGGATWKKRKNFTEDALKQIWFSDSQNGWMLCERDIYTRGTNGSSYMLRTSDGGASWERFEFSGGRERITSFFFSPKGVGIAVGENGAIHEFRPEKGSWERQATNIRYLLLGGGFNDERAATLLGAGGSVYFSDDGGATWLTPNVSQKPSGKLNSVFFVNRTTGWIVGSGGTIMQTVSGGKSWRPQNSGTASDLTDIIFIDSAEGFAVGADGTILRTKTAGNVWTVEPTGIKHRLERVYFSGNKGFAVGFGGTLLTTEGASAPNLKR